MALYILVAFFFFGFGWICGMACAFVFGMIISKSQPQPVAHIETEILAEVLSERLNLEALASKAEKIR